MRPIGRGSVGVGPLRTGSYLCVINQYGASASTFRESLLAKKKRQVALGRRRLRATPQKPLPQKGRSVFFRLQSLNRQPVHQQLSGLWKDHQRALANRPVPH